MQVDIDVLYIIQGLFGAFQQTPHLPFSSKTWLLLCTYIPVAAASGSCTVGRYYCKDADGLVYLICKCACPLLGSRVYRRPARVVFLMQNCQVVWLAKFDIKQPAACYRQRHYMSKLVTGYLFSTYCVRLISAV